MFSKLLRKRKRYIAPVIFVTVPLIHSVYIGSNPITYTSFISKGIFPINDTKVYDMKFGNSSLKLSSKTESRDMELLYKLDSINPRKLKVNISPTRQISAIGNYYILTKDRVINSAIPIKVIKFETENISNSLTDNERFKFGFFAWENSIKSYKISRDKIFAGSYGNLILADWSDPYMDDINRPFNMTRFEFSNSDRYSLKTYPDPEYIDIIKKRESNRSILLADENVPLKIFDL